jgi:hypothetical protein
MPEKLTLWLVSASNNRTISEITHVYARCEAHARELAQEWLAHHSHLPYSTLRACPHSFQYGLTRLPGYMDDDEQQNTQ